jgi:hypothetical protein
MQMSFYLSNLKRTQLRHRMAQKMGMPKAMITILEPNMQVQARWSTTPLIKIWTFSGGPICNLGQI